MGLNYFMTKKNPHSQVLFLSFLPVASLRGNMLRISGIGQFINFIWRSFRAHKSHGTLAEHALKYWVGSLWSKRGDSKTRRGTISSYEFPSGCPAHANEETHCPCMHLLECTMYSQWAYNGVIFKCIWSFFSPPPWRPFIFRFRDLCSLCSHWALFLYAEQFLKYLLSNYGGCLLSLCRSHRQKLLSLNS